MGSITNSAQVDLASSLKKRNEKHGVNHEDKAIARKHLEPPGIHHSMLLYRAKTSLVIGMFTFRLTFSQTQILGGRMLECTEI